MYNGQHSDNICSALCIYQCAFNEDSPEIETHSIAGLLIFRHNDRGPKHNNSKYLHLLLRRNEMEKAKEELAQMNRIYSMESVSWDQ